MSEEEQIDALAMIAQIQIQKGEWSDAQSTLEMALKTAQEINDHILRAEALTKIAQQQTKANDPDGHYIPPI